MSAELFNSVLVKDEKYNRFDLTNDHKLSLNMGELVPVFWEEAVPGDKWNIKSQVILKFLPMIAPVMHRFNLFIHYFFVPMRIIWENFERYISHGGDYANNPTQVLPQFPFVIANSTSALKGSLLDYLGIPPWQDDSTDGEAISIMPLAAYQRIYDEYYRDENLIDSMDLTVNDGDNTGNIDWFQLRYRALEHDYYTSALPFAQKGPSVDIPLGDVTLKDLTGDVIGGVWRAYNDATTPVTGIIHADATTGAARAGSSGEGGSSNLLTAYDPNGTLGTTPTTITELRRAYALQRYFEKLARSGSRFKEYIKGMFNVNTGDARVDRPEYICGIRQNVVVGEVLSTATGELPQGNMAGHGIAVASGGGCNYYVREHGIVMGIMSVMPKTAYQNGIERKWLKITDPTEFYTPDFAHIGEQEIQKKELYAYQGVAGNAVFGYIPRYAEYKFSSNQVHGELRDTLSFWQGGQIFGSMQSLNQQFIEMKPDKISRIFAVDGEDQDNLVAHVLNNVSVARKMPRYGNPI